jgi:spore photoproduct lyase
MGCRSSCTYCFLQAHARRLPLFVFAGVSEFFREIGHLLSSVPRSVQPLLCTGEHADSLADSNMYPIGGMLVEEIGRRGRGWLELRTKSDAIDSLLGLDHRDRTVVAFSLAPQATISIYEGHTASVEARLRAAQRCQASGYRIALKIEPLHLGLAWRPHYQQLIKHAASVLDPAGISHVAVGSLRASASLRHKPAFRRHHGHALQKGEVVPYRQSAVNAMPPQSDRLRAYRSIEGMLRDEGIRAPIWWSMETPEMVAILSSGHTARIPSTVDLSRGHE